MADLAERSDLSLGEVQAEFDSERAAFVAVIRHDERNFEETELASAKEPLAAD